MGSRCQRPRRRFPAHLLQAVSVAGVQSRRQLDCDRRESARPGNLLPPSGWRSLLTQVQLARTHVGVHAILSLSLAIEGTKQSTFRNTERRRVELPAIYRRIHARNFLRLSNLHRELAKAEFDVLVASHIAYIELPGKHADVQGRRLRNLNSRLKVVVRASREPEIGAVSGDL